MTDRLRQRLADARANPVTPFDATRTVDDSIIHSALRAAIERDKAELAALREAKKDLLEVCQEANRVLEMMDALGDFPKNQLWLIQKLNKTIIKHGGKDA